MKNTYIGLTLAACLRSCLEIITLSQAIQHDAGHSDINPSFVDASQSFIVLTETT
jgi:hypothetical protein